MKTLLKLVLVYFIAQILGALAVVPFCLMYLYLTQGTVTDASVAAVEASSTFMIPAMLCNYLIIGAYLWKRGYLTDDDELYAPLSKAYLAWSVLLGASAIGLISTVMEFLPQLPDWMESGFEGIMQSGWAGIACIVLLGPIMEELFFRGAVTKELLRRYRPSVAILVSGLCFGLIHVNPAQVLPACFMGFLLAWLYHRTGSLIPGILIHVLNNGFSVWLTMNYPEAERLSELMPPVAYVVLMVIMLLGGLLAFCMIRGWIGAEDRKWRDKPL